MIINIQKVEISLLLYFTSWLHFELWLLKPMHHTYVSLIRISLMSTCIINARRMRTRVTVLCVCVCVCVSVSVCVCPLSTRRLEGLYYNLNILAGFTLILQGFQLTDFCQMLSFKSYSLFLMSSRPFVVLLPPYTNILT